MLLVHFKKIVDQYPSNIEGGNHLGVCKQLGIDTKQGYSSHMVNSKLYDNIQKVLTVNSKSTDKISKLQLIRLQTELIYRYVLYEEDPIEYLQVLRVINDSCRADHSFFPPFSENTKWAKAITNAKNYNIFSPNTHRLIIKNIRNDYPKDFDRALSLKELENKGCKIEIKDSEIFIVNGLEQVVEELDQRIKEMGGITVVRSLFSHLVDRGKYSPRFERYFISREASGISFDQSPQICYGYLLNLALKYPEEKLKLNTSQKKLNEIINLAKIITNGTYGVQHYNRWEYFFQTGETIIQFCTEISLWDSIFSIPQCRPSTSLRITDKLFNVVEKDVFFDSLGFTKENIILVISTIQDITTKTNGPIFIYTSAINKRLNSVKTIDKTGIIKILNFLSHQEMVNKDYLLPSDYINIDFFLKPLLKLSDTKFVLIDASWSAPNYYESIATSLRSSVKNLDSKIGFQLENFLEEELSNKGITYCSGEYKIDGIDGECDLIIESKEAIVLIEFKKKVLTRKAKSGIDINILLDLSESLLAAQIQATRTEIFLKEKESIQLKSRDGETFTVSLKNREVEKVALTQLEFGGFQDRTIINQLLNVLLTHSFGTYSEDQNIIKKFEKLNVMQEMWLEQYHKINELDSSFSHFPFFNCWFLSLPQLIEIINLSTDNDSFYEVFKKPKHISFSTLDWYKEFDMSTKITTEK